MKIVHCLFSMKMGGAQVLTVDLLNEMGRFHEVALIVVNDTYSPKLLRQLSGKVSVHYLNRKEGSRNLLPVIRLNRLLRQLRPDVIHCHERKMIRLIHYRQARKVYTVHDVSIPADTFRHYDALVAISESVAADVRSRSKLPVEVVRNGVPLRNFVKRSHYTVGPASDIRLVQISRLAHEKKGQDVLIRALARLVHDHRETKIRLDFIGDGTSKEYLAALAESLNLSAHINFLGEQDRAWVAQHLATYHLLVQPSRFEGFGLTVVEGFAAGLPVVASDIDGPAEIMRQLPAGFLFASDDVASCVRVLRRVIDAYRRGQIEALLHQTYPTVETHYSIQSTVANYLSVYGRLVASGSVVAPTPIFSPQLRPLS